MPKNLKKKTKAKKETKPKKTEKPKPKPKTKKKETKSKLVSKKDIEKAKSFYGGTFPKVNGRKWNYPEPTQEVEWVMLIREAKIWRSECIKCYHQKKMGKVFDKKDDPTKHEKRAMYRYVLFEARPEFKNKRNIRTKDRYNMQKSHDKILSKGDNLELHHENQDTMDPKKVKVLTKCQHLRAHGKVCKKENSSDARKAKKATIKLNKKKKR
jgi:hypothetical protein